MNPPTLFDPEESTLDARFAAFDAAHPEVWKLYVRFAFELKRAGRDRGSSEQIIQRIRWETNVNPSRDDDWKINDHYRKRYARKMVAEFPEFEGFFEFRESRLTGLVG